MLFAFPSPLLSSYHLFLFFVCCRLLPLTTTTTTTRLLRASLARRVPAEKRANEAIGFVWALQLGESSFPYRSLILSFLCLPFSLTYFLFLSFSFYFLSTLQLLPCLSTTTLSTAGSTRSRCALSTGRKWITIAWLWRSTSSTSACLQCLVAYLVSCLYGSVMPFLRLPGCHSIFLSSPSPAPSIPWEWITFRRYQLSKGAQVLPIKGQ